MLTTGNYIRCKSYLPSEINLTKGIISLLSPFNLIKNANNIFIVHKTMCTSLPLITSLSEKAQVKKWSKLWNMDEKYSVDNGAMLLHIPLEKVQLVIKYSYWW